MLRKIYPLAFLVALFALFSCKKKEKTVVKAPVVYPYSTPSERSWESGNPENTVKAMQALREFEKGNIAASMTYFGDSVSLHVDGFDGNISRDSLGTLFKKSREGLRSFVIKMEDYESLRSKSDGMDYITLRYKQIWTDKTGKTDSIDCVNEMKMDRGKIVLLDEKIRRYGALIEK